MAKGKKNKQSNKKGKAFWTIENLNEMASDQEFMEDLIIHQKELIYFGQNFPDLDMLLEFITTKAVRELNEAFKEFLSIKNK